MTALHFAADNGHTEVADILINNRSFVNSKTKVRIDMIYC